MCLECDMLIRFSVLTTLILAATGLGSTAQALEVHDLRCEYLREPRGMDVVQPRLSWKLGAGRRGEFQSAYQILVASDPGNLRENVGDLWDTGRVASGQSVQVAYEGRPLRSRLRVWWKVRVWGAEGKVSAWSPPGTWTMGLLDPGDWSARWIGDAQSIDQAMTTVASGPHNGFHSALANSPDVVKWVAVDLGLPQQIEAVQLYPARPFDWQPDTPGFLFPLRFRIVTAQQPDFSDARSVIDKTGEDQPNPGTNAPFFQFAPITARYVRLEVTRLGLRSGTDFGLALAEMAVWSGGTNVARGAKVTALDSIESGGWAPANLVDGRTLPDRGQTPLPARPAVQFRRTFPVPQGVQRATVYATGLGLYELRLNGERVGDQLLAPEWTSYGKRIQYQTYDVTKLLRSGANTLGVMVGEGWYLGRLMGIPGNAYGIYPRFLLQLEIELTDGSRRIVVTDESWRSSLKGPIRSAGIYDGETYDARREEDGSKSLRSEDSAWLPVRVVDGGPARLVWQRNEPIRVQMDLNPVALTEPKPGVYVFDFGQNMVGWCRLKLKGSAGQTVILRHAEMLKDDGTVYTANLRGAPQIDRYTLRGDGTEVFEPHFTYHGFRFVEVTGLSRRPSVSDITGRVFHSSASPAGTLVCSDAGINQLLRNILWTQRGNLMSSPNDCPQRDERFGWMGDIQVFAQTASFNLDMAAFFSKWVLDIRDDQAADGRFPDYAPHPGDSMTGFSGAPAWADAGVIVPWRAYQNYANVRLLAEHFESARRWVDSCPRSQPRPDLGQEPQQ